MIKLIVLLVAAIFIWLLRPLLGIFSVDPFSKSIED